MRLCQFLKFIIELFIELFVEFVVEFVVRKRTMSTSPGNRSICDTRDI
jgi:hypothetical protein